MLTKQLPPACSRFPRLYIHWVAIAYMDATCKDCLIYCNCGKNASSQLNFLYPVGKVIFRLFCPRTRNDSLRKQCTRSPLVTLKCCCLPGISEKRTKFGNLIRHFSQTWSLGYSQKLRMLVKFFRSEDSCYIELDPHLVSVRVWIQGTNRLLKNLYVYVENFFSVSALSHGKKTSSWEKCSFILKNVFNSLLAKQTFTRSSNHTKGSLSTKYY